MRLDIKPHVDDFARLSEWLTNNIGPTDGSLYINATVIEENVSIYHVNQRGTGWFLSRVLYDMDYPSYVEIDDGIMTAEEWTWFVLQWG